MLQVNHLTLTHLKYNRHLIEDLSFVVNSGDRLAIIGEEGTGKSTLLKWLYRPEILTDDFSASGQVTSHFKEVGYLAQELTVHDLGLSIADFIDQDINYDRFDFGRLYQMAAQLQFDTDYLDNRQLLVSQLSGGERLKLQLIKLLAYNPDLFLLDEPTSDLDVTSMAWLERFIQQCPATVILVSHNETFLRHTATAVLHLEMVKKRQETRHTFEAVSYEVYQQERSAKFERQLQKAKSDREVFAKRQAKMHRIHQSVEHTVRNTHDATAGRLIAKKMRIVLAQEKRYTKEAKELTEIPVDTEAIQVFFSDIQPLPASKTILNLQDWLAPQGQRVSLTLKGQDKIAIIGENGIGKSRLLGELLALLKDKGVRLAYMPQSYDLDLSEEQTPVAFLVETCQVEEEICRSLLASLLFTRQEIQHSCLALSGGQKAKLYLAKLILQKPQLLILDEPSRHFSSLSQPQLRQILQDYPGAIISISHDRLFLKEVPQKIYQLTKDRLVEYSSTES